MANLTWDDLEESRSNPGSNAIADLANAAADAFCDSFQANPGAFVTDPFDTSGGALLGALADRICRPRNKIPPPPQKPFTGGRCSCIQYRVSYTAYANGAVWYSTYADLPGPISGLSLGATGNLKTIGFFYGAANCGGRRRFNIISNFENYGNQQGAYRAEITGVTRLTPGADTCGDPAPQYPPSVPPLSDLFKPAIVNIAGAPTSLPVKVRPVSPPAFPTSFPLFSIDLGGIDVNFSLGGVSINPTVNIGLPSVLPVANLPPGFPDIPYTPPPSIPELAPIGDQLDNISDSLESTNNGVTDANNKLDDLADCDRCKPTINNPTQAYSVTESRTVTGLPHPIQHVRLSLDIYPSNPKTEPGGNAPTVYYAGWFWFRTSGGVGDRLPIDALEKCFYPPQDVTGFSYTCRKGYQASAVVTMRQEIYPEA